VAGQLPTRRSRKQPKLIDAPRQSKLAKTTTSVNYHPARPPRLIQIVAPFSSRLSRDRSLRARPRKRRPCAKWTCGQDAHPQRGNPAALQDCPFSRAGETLIFAPRPGPLLIAARCRPPTVYVSPYRWSRRPLLEIWLEGVYRLRELLGDLAPRDDATVVAGRRSSLILSLTTRAAFGPYQARQARAYMTAASSLLMFMTLRLAICDGYITVTRVPSITYFDH
jgi:hypothetical protein